MEPTEAGAARQVAGPADRREELSASARGWHTIQMAVLGFIGICGVLRTTGSPAPRAVQWLAAALAVAALAAASVAVFTVGRVAYPVDDAADGASARPAAGQAAARLRAGIRLTIVAVILAVIAALSGWWPAPASTAAVAVTATSGQAWCGPLVNGPAGAVSVRTGNGVIAVPAQAIAQVGPVARCPLAGQAAARLAPSSRRHAHAGVRCCQQQPVMSTMAAMVPAGPGQPIAHAVARAGSARPGRVPARTGIVMTGRCTVR